MVSNSPGGQALTDESPPHYFLVQAKFFEAVAPCMNVRGLGGEFGAKIGAPMDVPVEMSFPLPYMDQPRDVSVCPHLSALTCSIN